MAAAKAQQPGHNRDKSSQCQGGPCALERLLTNPQGLLLLRRRLGSHCRKTQTSGKDEIDPKKDKSRRQGCDIEVQPLPGGDLRSDQHAKRENKGQEPEHGAAKLASQLRLLPENSASAAILRRLTLRITGAAVFSCDFAQNIFPRM